MKTIQQISFFSLIIAFVLYSCTMQKRVYNNGYHVEWNKSNRTIKKQELPAELRANLEEKTVDYTQNEIIQTEGNTIALVEQTSSSSAEIASKQVIVKEKLPVLNNLIQKSPVLEKITKPYVQMLAESAKATQEKSPALDEENERNTLALVGFIFGILAVVTIVTGIGGLVFGILGLVFSRSAMGETDAGSRDYQMAKAGMIMSIVVLALILVALLLFLLLIAAFAGW